MIFKFDFFFKTIGAKLEIINMNIAIMGNHNLYQVLSKKDIKSRI